MTRKTTTLLIIVLTLVALGAVLAQGMMGPGTRNGFGSQNYGMMGSQGYGMMGGGMMGGGMMGGGMMGGGMMQIYPAGATPISLQEAEARIREVADRYGATVADVMTFSNNYYAQLIDSDGVGLGEVLVDRYTGLVTPEPGPNMMWNATSGMMVAFTGNPRFEQPEAEQLANDFLADYLPGAQVLAGQAFRGYYTFDYGRNEIEGMLSINAYSGEVWLHSWHGAFLGEEN